MGLKRPTGAGRILKVILCTMIIAGMLLPTAAYARGGDCGYEGGISSGEAAGKTSYEYQELCFVSGEPILLKGTMTLKKSAKADGYTSTYTYNLKNTDKNTTLSRTLTFTTKVTKKDSGQSVEETTLSKPTESLKIGNTVYVLKNYDFTRSSLIDSKPAINYYAGNIWGRKSYQSGIGQNTSTVVVEQTGNFYGFDQYWSSTEVQTINYIINTETKNNGKTDKWGGTASISLSSTTTKQLKYVDNRPNEISFEGGYVQSQFNNSILEYTCRLPEFDAGRVSTDKIITTKNSLKLETFPAQTRLPVPSLGNLKGYWYENDVKMLYSLEVLKGGAEQFKPEKFMTRSEFASAVVQAAKEVPQDPSLASKTAANTRTTSKKQVQISTFMDVPTDYTYYSQIESAFKRGLISGKGDNTFAPDDYLTVADALTIFIRALGLEALAPSSGAVTTFKDNDQIPTYARNAAYVAEKIGIIKGDDKGNLNPREHLTNARSAALVNRFINYMRDGIKKDYRERIVNYN